MEKEKSTGLIKAKAKVDMPSTTVITDNDEKPSIGLGAFPKLPAEKTMVGEGTLDNQYFFEDEIFRVDKKGRVKFGLVIETSDQYSGDEDDEFDDVLSKGEVRVSWYPEGMEEVQPEEAVGLADRTLMPGDVVRRLVPGKEAQLGYCRELNVRADVKVLGTKYVIKNVMAERLRLLTNWQRDSAVCLDSWVGSIKDIDEKSVLKSTIGARIEISSSEFYAFKEVNSRNSYGIFKTEVFYPGNVVVGRLPSLESVNLLTPEIPLYTNKKGKPITSKYTIESVYNDSVFVQWQCKALSEEPNIQSSALQQPKPWVTGDDLKRLKRLNLFDSCMLQISDRNYLKYSKFDTIVKKSKWDKEQGDKFKGVLTKQHKQNENQNMFVQNTEDSVAAGAGINSGSPSWQQFEKIKKKLNLIDSDKSNKSKKFAIKVVDKLSSNNTASKEKSQSDVANSKSTLKTVTSDQGWVSDDDDDVDIEGFYDATLNLKDECISTTTTISTCSSPSPLSSPQKQRQPNRRQIQKKKTAKNLKKTFSAVISSTSEFVPQDGQELVTEALLVYSTATVVWQDGSVEYNIPSTNLYPIHHLDNHEFFPGDFVISAIEVTDVGFRDYGVIQAVDHHGRTAHVKWYTTYTSADEAKPAYKGETEVSVYDLKDHPDFQYRPGTMVIRVANFVGEDASCTAGQIIDNYIDGRVKVWWVDGHISMCWPQDLFEVGQYDNADWGGAGNESEDSWETESENSEFGAASSPKLSIAESHILLNVERARVAIARLEEIFNISPTLQSPEVMRKLLAVYKSCRYLDRLLNTSFFHEDNFLGLLERVRKCGTQTISERVQDRKNRLFSDGNQTSSPNGKQSLQSQPLQHQHQQQCHYQAIVAVNNTQKLQNSITANSASVSVAAPTNSKEYAPKVLFNISSTSFKCTPSSSSICSHGSAVACGAVPSSAYKRKFSPAGAARTTDVTNEEKPSVEVPTCLYSLLTTKTTQSAVPLDPLNPNDAEALGVTAASIATDTPNPIAIPEEISPNRQNCYNAEKNLLLSSAMLSIEKATEKTSLLRSTINNLTTATTPSQEDSGNCSRIENCDGSSTSYASSSDLTTNDANNSLMPVKSDGNNDDQKSVSCISIELAEDVAPELVCVNLCTLLKDQLVKCINEIREKYYKEDSITNLSNVVNIEQKEAEIGENLDTVVDLKKSVDSGLNSDVAMNVFAFPKDLETPTESVENEEEAATVVSTPTLTEAVAVAVASSSTSASAVVAPLQSPQPAECFQVLPNAPTSHKFHLTIFHPNNPQQYYRAVQREHRVLKNSLPPGVWIRVFEDRMDLLSVMIAGPEKTPYEGGIFFFDIQLGREYPKSPPVCHYISYCSDRLNPNLYEDGKVCVSLLGTWSGRDSEVWGPKSTLLQVIVSIQGLILVPEPYFNEAGYEKQKGSQQGLENSRMYNEMVVIKMVQSTTKLMHQLPPMFRREILEHFHLHGLSMYKRVKGWMELSKLELPTMRGCGVTKQNTENVGSEDSENLVGVSAAYAQPDFPLVPASRGFCLTLASLLDTFRSKLEMLAVAREIQPAAVAVKVAGNEE